ncbi:Palmitoyl-protein thioesterase 1, partial [Cladochytrium tenue]
MGTVAGWIAESLPETYIYSIQIGDDEDEDRNKGFFDILNRQVDEVCEKLQTVEELVDGFNAVGFSQGGLFLRAYVERCNQPPVRNLITFGSPHMGVSDAPNCDARQDANCSLMRRLIRSGSYLSWIQNRVVQAQYFKNPHDIPRYLEKSIFLPDVNNEREDSRNATYKSNLLSLQKLWFGFVDESLNVIDMKQQPLYTEDWIGIRALDEQGRLDLLTHPGGHMRIDQAFFADILVPSYLAGGSGGGVLALQTVCRTLPLPATVDAWQAGRGATANNPPTNCQSDAQFPAQQPAPAHTHARFANRFPVFITMDAAGGATLLPLPEERYSGIAAYQPSNPDEIEVRLNDVVAIFTTYDDGWVMAKNESTGHMGLLPRNFLSSAPIAAVDKAPPVATPDVKSAEPPAAALRTSSVSRKDDPPPFDSLPPSSQIRPTDQKGAVPNGTSVGASAPILPELSAPSPFPTELAQFAPASGSSAPQAIVAPKQAQSSGPSSPIPTQSTSPVASVSNIAPSGPSAVPEYLSMGRQIRSNAGAAAAGVRERPFASVRSYAIPVVSRSEAATAFMNPIGLIRVEDLVRNSSPVATSREALLRKLEGANMNCRQRAPRNAATIGSLSMMFVGDSGIGKTSLIEAFSKMPHFFENTGLPSTPFLTTRDISEVRLSSVPHGALFSGEDPYNIKMVDTPGFGAQMDAISTIEPIVQHVLTQFQTTDNVFEKLLDIPNIIRFVDTAKGSHSHIDICIYGILHRLKPVDLEFMRRLAPWVNLVPVMVKCDTLKRTEIAALKISILEEIVRARIPIYGFGLDAEELLALARSADAATANTPMVPFAISTHSVMTGG